MGLKFASTAPVMSQTQTGSSAEKYDGLNDTEHSLQQKHFEHLYKHQYKNKMQSKPHMR